MPAEGRTSWGRPLRRPELPDWKLKVDQGLRIKTGLGKG